MKSLKTITVGIPAYNESINIVKLIDAIRAQQLSGYKIVQILVISDASTDDTDQLVRAIHDSRIRLFRNPRRLGQSLSQNILLKKATGDVLILLNADTLPAQADTLQHLADTVTAGADYAIARAWPVPARTWFERVINYSVYLRTAIFERFPDYDTVYLCGGRGRAMSQRLYRKFRWKKVFTEDVFAYLYCDKYGYKTQYQPKSVILFRSPIDWRDHSKQSRRFRAGPEELYPYFGEETVKQSFRIPLAVALPAILYYLVRYPFWSLAYFVVYLFTTLAAPPQASATWSVSASSKGLTS